MQIGSIHSDLAGLGFTVVKPKTSAFAYYDPRDTNRNGIVSAEEDYLYSLNHPMAEALKRLKAPASTQTSSSVNHNALSSYSRQGTLNASGWTTQSLIDTYI
jgi:hypothetical protein